MEAVETVLAVIGAIAVIIVVVGFVLASDIFNSGENPFQ